MAEVQYRKPLDDNLPWEQRLANYAQNPNAGRDEYKRSLEVFRGKSAAGDTAGANAAKTWMGQVDTAIGGAATQPNDDMRQQLKTYLDRSQKPVTPFQYDANTDPAFQAQKRMVEQDTQRDMNNARVEAGANNMRGGSLQNNQLSQLSAQNQARLQNQILPNSMAQAYQRYRDQQNQEQQQNQNLLQYVGTMGDLNQRDLDNQYRDNALADKQKQDRIGQAQWGVNTYGYGEAKEDPQVFFDQYKDQLPLAMKQYLANREDAQFGRTLQEAGVTGMYNDRPTLQRQGQEFNQNAENQRIALSAQGQAQSAANQAANLGLNQQRFDWERDPNNPDNQYKMAQIGKTTNQAKVDAKQSASNYSELTKAFEGSKGLTRDTALGVLNDNADQLSDSDYKRALDWIDKYF